MSCDNENIIVYHVHGNILNASCGLKNIIIVHHDCGKILNALPLAGEHYHRLPRSRKTLRLFSSNGNIIICSCDLGKILNGPAPLLIRPFHCSGLGPSPVGYGWAGLYYIWFLFPWLCLMSVVISNLFLPNIPKEHKLLGFFLFCEYSWSSAYIQYEVGIGRKLVFCIAITVQTMSDCIKFVFNYFSGIEHFY